LKVNQEEDQPQDPAEPHPEQELPPPALKSTEQDRRNPISMKSTLMGFTFSRKSFSTMYLKPSMSNS
jgi:hypothetical protein